MIDPTPYLQLLGLLGAFMVFLAGLGLLNLLVDAILDAAFDDTAGDDRPASDHAGGEHGD